MSAEISSLLKEDAQAQQNVTVGMREVLVGASPAQSLCRCLGVGETWGRDGESGGTG